MAEGKKRRYHVKPLPITILFALLIMICIGAAALLSNRDHVELVDVPVSETISSQPESEEEPPPPEPVSARLIGVGDNLIHTAIYQQAQRRADGVGYDFDYAYANIKDIIKLADIASINQETVMVKEQSPSSYPMFNSPTELGDYLCDIGFDVFNLANNHSLDMVPSTGETALTSYLNFWASHPEVAATGLYRNQEDYDSIRTLERNGITFSFIGMTEYTNGLSMPKDTDVILMMTSDEAAIQERIEKAKSISDVVVVNIHWGVEYTNEPNEFQKSLAQKMSDWGADIILGHHPHVLQPVEWLEREDGTRALVAYSLGNFISGQDTGYRMIGGALDVTATKDPATGAVTLSDARFIPLITHFDGNWGNIRIYPRDQYTEELAQAHGVRGGKTANFSLDFIDQVVSEVIPEEFMTPYNEGTVSGGTTSDDSGVLSDAA